MVHEITKTIRTFFDREVIEGNSTNNVESSIANRIEIIEYLNSSVHSN